MASYKSYKKIIPDGIKDGAIVDSHFTVDSSNVSTFGVKWFYGEPCACSTGCCCLWTVPTGVSKMHIELWGSGGSGHGSCNVNRCHHQKGAGGGYYNSKMITTAVGCPYTVCAAGNGNCCRFECVGCVGCASYITGFNLSNFCAIGGSPGCANTDWTTKCTSAWDCCILPNAFDGDFGFGNHTPGFNSAEFWAPSSTHCQCWTRAGFTGSAPLLGTEVFQSLNFCWFRCGCFSVPYGHGGQGSYAVFCGTSNCCGQGGMGGPGLVKITYF